MANALTPNYQPYDWNASSPYHLTGWDGSRGDAYRYNPSADVSGNGEIYTANPEFLQHVNQSGFKPVTWIGEDGLPWKGILDPQGNLIPESAQTGHDDRAFWNGALLAGAVTGANMGAAGFGANGLEAGTASGAEAGGGAFLEANAGAGAPVGNAGGLSAYQGAQGAGTVAGSGTTAGTKTAGGGLMGMDANTWANLAQTGIGLYSQNKATDAQSAANAQQLALLREMWQANRADNQPLLDMRNSVLPKINALMADPSSVANDPGYQFGLRQGQNQINNSLAAQGGYYSGQQLKASQKFGQDYAGTKLTDSLNRLMGVAGLGQVGATQNQQNNSQFGQLGGNSLMQGGNIRGSGYMGMGNIAGSGVANWYNNWQDQQLRGG